MCGFRGRPFVRDTSAGCVLLRFCECECNLVQRVSLSVQGAWSRHEPARAVRECAKWSKFAFLAPRSPAADGSRAGTGGQDFVYADSLVRTRAPLPLNARFEMKPTI